jgi:hypothetical protein
MSGREEVRAWLEGRQPVPPASLRAQIDSALAGVPGAQPESPALAEGEGRVAGVLGEAALDRLRAALGAGKDRRAAMDLLAADALLTYACEAAAEAGPDALEALIQEYGPERLARLL